MKVGLLENTNNNRINYERKSQVGFRAKADWGKVNNEINKQLPWIPRALMYLGKNDGEILNTLVTAVGTAVVAPIFIAGNPFSKEDKDTKWYTAMRQPISAVIALIMQLGVNKAYNNYMDKMASTGAFGEFYDVTAKPLDPYLRRIIKLEHPEYDKKQIRAEIDKRQKAAERRVVGQQRIRMKDANITIDDLVSKDALDKAEKKLLEELEPTLKGKSKLETKKIIKEKITKEIILERAKADIQKNLDIEVASKYVLRRYKENGYTVEQVIEKLNNKSPKTDKAKAIVKDLLERLGTIQEYESLQKIENPNYKPFASVKDLGKNYKEIKHNVIVKRFVKAKTSDAAKSFKKFRNMTGIGVSLLTLPFSCGLLNWAYPRIMEKVMPPLSKWIHRNDPIKPEEQIIEAKSKTEAEEEDDDD